MYVANIKGWLPSKIQIASAALWFSWGKNRISASIVVDKRVNGQQDVDVRHFRAIPRGGRDAQSLAKMDQYAVPIVSPVNLGQ